MSSRRIETLKRLVMVRKVRLTEAQSRHLEADARAEDAARQVNDAEALLADYGLDRLGAGVPIVAVERQRRFAGKVGELLQNRRVQATRLSRERERRFMQLTLSRNQLRMAEKLASARAKEAEQEEARKLRRRSIHRPGRSGTLVVQTEVDKDSCQDGHPAGNQYGRSTGHDIGDGTV